jgi:curved DNA-binding protein CbpA
MTDTIPDFYAIMGVPADATAEQIKAAFRRQAKQCHPDAGGSHEQMVHLLAAFEILSDPEQRAVYDALRQAGEPKPEQQATYEQAKREAEAVYAARGGNWDELMEWIDQRSAHIQTHPIGRMAAGGLGGLLIGSVVGTFAGYWLGIGGITSAVTGGLCGTLGGVLTAGTGK